jgi:hypothetical protein
VKREERDAVLTLRKESKRENKARKNKKKRLRMFEALQFLATRQLNQKTA